MIGANAAVSVKRPQAGHAVGRAIVRLMVAAIVIAVLYFAVFLWRIPAQETPLAQNADAIVVLTGGSDRVNDAIELLAAGRGKRLLVSGAHPSTRLQEISRINPDGVDLAKCCIDVEHSARNTLGNAAETRGWTRQHGFHSLIVVTSNYHMTRAMAELRHQLPDVTLIPYPVVSDKLRAEPWWSSGATMRLVASEYVKYVAALVRMQVAPLVRRALA